MIPREQVSVPWATRWHRFRLGKLPFVGFAACVVTTALLWKQQGEMPNAVGRVEAVRVNVASGVDGRLIPLVELEDRGGKWTQLDSVSKGDIVARLDDAPLRALLDALRGDLGN